MRSTNEKSYITKISSVNHEGKGITYENNKTLFIDNALLDEVVEYKILKKKKNLAFGKSLKILKSSSQRVEAKCNVYGICGGCSMQHFDEAKELIKQ